MKKRLDALEAEIKIVLFKETLMCQTCGPAEDFFMELGAQAESAMLKAVPEAAAQQGA